MSHKVQKVLWVNVKESRAIWSYSVWEPRLPTDGKRTAARGQRAAVSTSNGARSKDV